MSYPILTIEEDNLSHAWTKALLAASKTSVNALSPLAVVINVDSGIPKENLSVRCEVDSFLRLHRKRSCAETSNTIFPNALWNPQVDRKRLFERYSNILPKLKKVPANRNGLYFERLVAYGGKCNQLEHLISTYQGGNHRASALLASIFDPHLDHTNQRQRGFPCLQQVTFTPLDGGNLGVTGFYATQYLIDRAYGNYLGLAALGRFVAHEIGLELTRVTCIASLAKIGKDIGKDEVRSLIGRLQPFIPTAFREEQL